MNSDLINYYDTEQALPMLSAQLGMRVKRPTLGAWVNSGFLPAIRLAGGRALLIPKAAVPLFHKPKPGRYARRENLARGVGIALRVLGTTQVMAADGMVGAMCPRCGGPWVIRGGLPTVSGHEADLCCCNLDCLYIGPDFLACTDPRVRMVGDQVEMHA